MSDIIVTVDGSEVLVLTVAEQGPKGDPGEPGGGGGNLVVKQVEIDVGAVPVPEYEATITDPDITVGKRVMAQVSSSAPTGKTVEELLMDSFYLTTGAFAGGFFLRIRGLEGFIHDKFKIDYFVVG